MVRWWRPARSRWYGLRTFYQLRIILVDLDGDAVRLGIGGERACGKRNREKGSGRKTAEHDKTP
jgi:hypothetical protein